MSREELLACCGMTDGELRELEAAGGTDETKRRYQETVGLAAALRQVGFSLEEIRAYFHERSREDRQMLLADKRWQIVREIHERQIRLGKVDYLMYLERR